MDKTFVGKEWDKTPPIPLPGVHVLYFKDDGGLRSLGADGVETEFAESIVGGTITGDITRYNSISGSWEVAHEPLHFAGLVLTPALASLIDAEGAIYYDSALKAILVCVAI